MRGVLLVGSAALGDYVPGVSDLDVVVVAPGPLEDPEALAAPLRHAELPCPARKLELVVYLAEQAAAPTRELEFELDLNTGPETDRLLTGLGREPAHWYLIDLAIGREHGVALSGPPPRELIGEPPREDVLSALAAGIRSALDEEPESPSTVLNACRAARYALHGDWTSKAAAGDWAVHTGSDPRLAQDALAARAGEPRELRADRVALLAEEALGVVEGAR
jgi:hypothetical protein